MAVQLNDEACSLVGSDTVAAVVTLREDGSPHVSAAWVGLEGDEIVLATLGDQHKLRNLRHDPRIAITLPASPLRTR